MIPTTEELNFSGRSKVVRHPIKLTALLYLREALLDERYEDCDDAIQVAFEFGAHPYEITDLLEDARRMPYA